MGVGAEAQPRDRLDAACRLGEPVERQAAILDCARDRPADALDGLVGEVVAEAEGVGARQRAPARRPPRRRPCPLTARISSASVITSPSKPSSARSSPVEHVAAHRRRRSSSAGTTDVRGHDRLHAGLDRGPERQQRGRERRRSATRQLEVRVLRRVAVAREVLRAGGDAAPLEARARTPRRAVRRAPGRSRTSGRRSRGSSGFEFTSATGREVEVDADRGAESPPIAARDRARSARRRRRRRAPRLPGVRAAASRLEPRDVAALLVDPDQRSGRSARSDAVSAASCSRSRDVVGEEADAAEALPRAGAGSSPAARARESSGTDAGRREPLELAGGHPLHRAGRQPEARSSAGRAGRRSRPGSRSASTPPSAPPQSVSRLVPRKYESQSVSVCFDWSVQQHVGEDELVPGL